MVFLPLLPSPTGQQFLSCNEAASFLRSYFGNNDADQQRDPKTSSIQQAYALSSEMVNVVISYSVSLLDFFFKFLCKSL